ncbi:MAG: NAD(P)-binding protein [Telmatospirillum sp.]|nr:NAD(P)-binding protein [Telmatospirillum sp.]
MRRQVPIFGVIGGGLSGSLMAIHLLRRLPAAGRVHLIEKRGGFGLGLAYSTRNPRHLLNVPAARMSLFETEPDHFTTWLADRFGELGDPAGLFAPRFLYGTYVQSVLTRQMAGEDGCRNLFLFPDEAVSVALKGRGVAVSMACGRSIDMDCAILSVGNFLPEPPAGLEELASSPRFLPDPWDDARLRAIGEDSRIVIVGSGLTMVDLVLGLIGQGHRGPLIALSRRGLLPRRHAASGPPHPWSGSAAPLSAALHRIRARSGGGDWRAVIDGMRPVLQDLWQGLSVEEQRRFLRHARPWWDVHRHRMAPDVAAAIDDLLARGRLRVLAGQILSADISGDGVALSVRPRGGDGRITLEADHVINCSGPASDYSRTRNPLLRHLIESGLARPDPLGLGLDVDAGLHLLDAGGRPHDRLFALGPVTKGRFWETTAVPEIRRQALFLAEQLVAEND